MFITAIFESWHVGDGNYAPFHVGELVNLSFELEPKTIEVVEAGDSLVFEPLGQGEYRFCGTVLKVYTAGDSEDLALVQVSENFRFYIVAAEGKLYENKTIQGDGTLLLDHYLWVEFLDEYSDSPDLFSNLTVTAIRKVQIPEQFIHRHDKGKSLPTRLSPEDYATLENLETMDGQPFDEEFYIIDFDPTGVENLIIPRSFKG